MEFPETFERFAEEYGFKDDKEVYTNGSDLIQVFRVKQWLEHDNKLHTTEIDTAEQETCKEHIGIPKNATNGDMIKTLFPDIQVWEGFGSWRGNIKVKGLGDGTRIFRDDWWSAPYKAESENKG